MMVFPRQNNHEPKPLQDDHDGRQAGRKRRDESVSGENDLEPRRLLDEGGGRQRGSRPEEGGFKENDLKTGCLLHGRGVGDDRMMAFPLPIFSSAASTDAEDESTTMSRNPRFLQWQMKRRVIRFGALSNGSRASSFASSSFLSISSRPSSSFEFLVIIYMIRV